VPQPLTRPAERTALVVIDMINDFATPGGALYSEPVGAIVGAVAREIARATANGAPVIFICDTHLPHDPEFELFPPHALPGKGREIVPALDTSGASAVISKRRYSAFFGTDLDARLRALGVTSLRLVGNCTNICVFFTAADAANRDYAIEVVRDAVASFDLEAHADALRELEKTLGAKIV
jgi:nicotinamidase/pyrazinamidase